MNIIVRMLYTIKAIIKFSSVIRISIITNEVNFKKSVSAQNSTHRPKTLVKNRVLQSITAFRKNVILSKQTYLC